MVKKNFFFVCNHVYEKQQKKLLLFLLKVFFFLMTVLWGTFCLSLIHIIAMLYLQICYDCEFCWFFFFFFKWYNYNMVLTIEWVFCYVNLFIKYLIIIGGNVNNFVLEMKIFLKSRAMRFFKIHLINKSTMKITF